jgi:hypothetical protein
MLTDEACEELTFRIMADRVSANQMNARNRQIARTA